MTKEEKNYYAWIIKKSIIDTSLNELDTRIKRNLFKVDYILFSKKK